MNKLNLTVLIVLIHLIGFAQEANYRKDDETVYQHYLPDENQEYDSIKLAVNFVFLHGGTKVINDETGETREYYGNFDKNNSIHMQFIDHFKTEVQNVFKSDFVDKYDYGDNIDQSIFQNQYLNRTTIELEINTMWVEDDRWDYTNYIYRSIRPNTVYKGLIDQDCDCYYFYSDETSNTITVQDVLITPTNETYPETLRYNGKNIYFKHDSLNTQNELLNTPIAIERAVCQGCTEEVLVGYDLFYHPTTTEIILEETTITIPNDKGYNELFTVNNKNYIRLESPDFYFDGGNVTVHYALHANLRSLDQTVKDHPNYKKGVTVYFHENGNITRSIDDNTYSDEQYLGKLMGTHVSETPDLQGTENLYSLMSSVFTQYNIYANGLTYGGFKPSFSNLNQTISNGYKRTTAHEIAHNLNLRDDGSTVYLAEVDGVQTKVEYAYSKGRIENTNQNKDLRHSIFDGMRSPNSISNVHLSLSPNHVLGDNIRHALNTIKHAASRYERISQHFTNDSFDNTNLYVSQDVNEIWDFYYRSYSNIIVDGNKNLRVDNSLVMAPQSKIGVKNNSYFVLGSNSKLNPLEHNDIAWQGFEIEDNSYLLILPEATIPNNFNAQVIEQGMARGETVAFQAMDQDGFPVTTASILDEEKSNSILYQNTNNSSITISPNPADDYIKISSEFIPIKTVMITDMNGQLIKKTNKNFDNIDVSGISNGIYILNIITVDNNTEFKKVIIE